MYPMTSRYSFTCLGLVFASMWSLSFPDHLNISLLSTSSSRSNFSAQALLTVLNETTNLSETDLQFLYGLEYEDLVQTLREPLSKTFTGQMRFRSDRKTEVLDQMLTPSPRPVLLVVLERPANLIKIFRKIRKESLNSHVVKWLLITEENSGDNSILEIEEFVNEGTHVAICRINSLGHCNLLFSYIDSKGITRFSGATTRREEERISMWGTKHYSLSGREITVATLNSSFIVKLGKTLPDGSVEVISGSDVSMLNVFASALNFTYRAVIPDDKKWGNVQPDGSITGIVGMVARREVTFGMCGLALTENRDAVVDFPWLAVGASTVIVSRSPKEIVNTLAVFSPLQLKVWVSIIIAVISMGPVAFLLSHFLNELETEDFKLGLMWHEFNMFRGIVNQGVFIDDASSPIRIIFIFWLFFCLIYTATYSGMLTAMLALPAYEPPIDYLEDLPRAVKNGFTVGTLGGSHYEQFLKASEKGIFKQTWQLLDHEDRSKSFVYSQEKAAKRVVSEKFAYIIGNFFGRYFQRWYGTNKIHMSRETFNPHITGPICPTGSPLRDVIFDILLRLQAGGLIFKYIDDEFRKIPKVQSANEEETSSSFAISVTHLQAAFYMFFLGMLVASITLLIEKVVSSKQKMKNQFP